MQRLAIVSAVLCVLVGLHAVTHPPVRHEGRVADYAPRAALPGVLSRVAQPGEWVTLAGVPDLSAAESHRTGQPWNDGGRILVPLVPEGRTAATADRVALLIVRDLRKDQILGFHTAYRKAEKGGRLASLEMPVPAGPGRFTGMSCRVPLPVGCLAHHFGIKKDAIVTLIDPEGAPPSSLVAWTFIELGVLVLAGLLLLPLAARRWVARETIAGRVLEQHRSHTLWTGALLIGWIAFVGAASVALLAHDPAMLWSAGPVEAVSAAVLALMLLVIVAFASQRVVLTDEGIGFANALLGSSRFVRWSEMTGLALPLFPHGLVVGALVVETAERTTFHLVRFTVAGETLRAIRHALSGRLTAVLLERIRAGECVETGRVVVTDRELWAPAVFAPRPLRIARGAHVGGYVRIPWSRVSAVVGTEWTLLIHLADCPEPVRVPGFLGRNALVLPEIICTQVRAANPDARVELAKA